MTMISDEMLMAYVDGQIAADDRVRVEGYLATDPEARARLQVFVDTGPALARALDTATARPMPNWLVEAVVGGISPSSQAAGPGGTVKARFRTSPAGGISAGGLSAAIGRGIRDLWPVAAAAFAATVVGVGLGWNLRMTGSPVLDRQLIVSRADGQQVAGPALQKVLETAESGRATSLAGPLGDAVATAVMSFESQHAEICRQYRLQMPAPGDRAVASFEGIACRAVDGAWRVDAHMPDPARRAAPDKISPASGPGHSIVDAAVDRMISGDAFSREEEQGRLRQSWVKPASPPTISPVGPGGGPAKGR